MRRGCSTFLGVLLALAVVSGLLLWFGRDYVEQKLDPDPVTVAAASLQGLREQNRLSTFAARYVAVVTSRQSRLGLTARKTLIMPGMVRYEVDLARLDQDDVQWNAESNTLRITLPPIEVVGPDVDLDAIREYDEGGILMRLTDAEDKLDEANRQAAQRELVRQAREETPMRLARDATRRAVERSFAMPLRAVGVEANVEVYFPDERSGDREQWDVSPSIRDVLANRQSAQGQ
ncbi:DUF4230 domain-containing protein [Sphingosinithalassobacter sp. CS137]|uniref:DUF4230 domain-containing protein n=1 Tax=Sphingosinithalassobacter sp. CS137 TaxID=2762748 RepID=UPI00165D8D5F|nr:DUF4230 domain-containing protein [Sphingosinithalassobacter sp. CS137]